MGKHLHAHPSVLKLFWEEQICCKSLISIAGAAHLEACLTPLQNKNAFHSIQC